MGNFWADIIADASPYLAFDREQLSPAGACWLVQSAEDIAALPSCAVALKIGDHPELLRDCEDFFSAFTSVLIAIPAPDMAAEIAACFMEYLPAVRLYLPAVGAFRGHNSLAELVNAGGEKAMERLLAGVQEVPAPGLLALSDITAPERQGRAVLSGIPALDKTTGGFAPAELTVWTGKRGGGKSTLLSQIALEAVDQGHIVCAYSGELSAWRFRSWALLQAAGAEHATERIDSFSGKALYEVDALTTRAIDDWWKGKFFVYDNAAAAGTADSVTEVFKMASLRFGADVFIADNLMSLDYAGENEGDFYRQQSAFVGRLVAFAKAHGAHVHLVAHPRKTEAGRSLSADDVGGSGDITNRADNVLDIVRLEDADRSKHGCDTVLRILKNRAYGASGNIKLLFDARCRRFSPDGGTNRRLGWETAAFEELPPEQTPFD